MSASDAVETPPGLLLPLHTAGCVTKHRSTGLSGFAACRDDGGELRRLFRGERAKIVPGSLESYGIILMKCDLSNGAVPVSLSSTEAQEQQRAALLKKKRKERTIQNVIML